MTLTTVIRRDLLLALRQRADVFNTLLFFLVVVTMVPLGVGPETDTLRRIAPGIIWVAALLAALLSFGRLFANDHADGTLEQMLLSPTPLPLLVLAKVGAHWLANGLLLTLVAPVLALQYGLDGGSIGILVLTLLLGTPVLSLVGAIGAALTVGVRGAAVLLSLLVLPLVTPALIFGAGAVEAAAGGMDTGGHFSLLGAMLVAAMFLAPWAAAAGLRISLD